MKLQISQDKPMFTKKNHSYGWQVVYCPPVKHTASYFKPKKKNHLIFPSKATLPYVCNYTFFPKETLTRLSEIQTMILQITKFYLPNKQESKRKKERQGEREGGKEREGEKGNGGRKEKKRERKEKRERERKFTRLFLIPHD